MPEPRLQNRQGTYAQTSPNGYRLEVIGAPRALDPDRREALTRDFVELSLKASGGRDWNTYVPGQVGWVNYYRTEGARPQDYDRLALVYAGSHLAHFTALNVLWLDEAHPVLWIHVAITDPRHQGSGLLSMSTRALLAPEWMRSVAPVTYPVFRTPNPVVYEAMRAFASTHLGSPEIRVRSWHPQIAEDGRLRAVPDDVRSMATTLAKTLSPDCPWDEDHFVIRGYYRQFGPLYSEDTQFPCRVAGTREYFAEHVHLDTQDGLLVICEVETNAGRRAE